jgi:DNA gyrase subunit A
LKVYQIPEGSRSSKGRAIQNVLSIPDDKIKAYINVRTLDDPEYINNTYIVMATKRGIIKKTTLEAYSRPRTKGINAITVRDGDELLDAVLTNGREQIFIAARNGHCVRFNETDARPLGRTASGVRGINIDEDDEVIGIIGYDPSDENSSSRTVLVVSENGYGKRTDFDEYRLTKRGSKGVKTLNITDKTGNLVAIKNVTESDDLMIINRSGLIIRMTVSNIRVAGRATQGVKLINIKDGDAIAAVSAVANAEDGDIILPETEIGSEKLEPGTDNTAGPVGTETEEDANGNVIDNN